MQRLVIIDGFRGFFLLFMGIVHFNGALNTILGKINHHQLGWVEDAQGFVFISGLVVGLVYGKKYLRNPSVRAIYGPVWARVRTIYAHQAGLVLMLLAAALLLGNAAPGDLDAYREGPVTFTVSSLLLVSSANHLGILPMYIFFLLATPFVFRWLDRGYVAPFLVTMLVLWMAGQTGLGGKAMYHLQLALQDWGLPARFGIYFNLLGWQVLFFGGLYFGFRMAKKDLDLSWLAAPQYRLAFLIALGGIVALGLFDRLVEWQWLGQDYTAAFMGRTSRNMLSFIYVIAFALDLFAIVWLLTAGAEDRARWVRRASGGIAWLFSRPALVVLGQHSLHVFSFHILVYYLIATVAHNWEFSEFTRSLILVAGALSLYLAAWGHGWLQARDAAARAVTAAGD